MLNWLLKLNISPDLKHMAFTLLVLCLLHQQNSTKIL